MIIGFPTTSPITTPFTPPASAPPIFPILFPPMQGEVGRARKRKGKGRKYKYTPSYEALVFKIPGKVAKGTTQTGINFRPITKGFKWGAGTIRLKSIW